MTGSASQRPALHANAFRPSEVPRERPWECLLGGEAFVIASRRDRAARHLWLRYHTDPGSRGLTTMQLRVLGLAARGLADKEIGAVLEMAVGTVSSHLHHALRKTALGHRLEVVRLLGTISPPPSAPAAHAEWLPLPNAASARPLRAGLAVVTLPSPAPVLPVGLTPAEREVAVAVFDGWGNREIADRRGVSVRTVGHQLEAIFRKTGLSARPELILRLRGAEGSR